VKQGEVVTLLGRNGAGRTTTLRAIMGLTGGASGSIKINGVEAIGLPTYRSPTSASAIARKSAAFSPRCRPRKT
jgi:ABC-type branched-subunit amino acid transport system ATPase component